MARAVTIGTKNLRELQKAMKQGESALEVAVMNHVLFDAIKIFYDKVRDNLRSGDPKIKTGNLLRDVTIWYGKSAKVARAYVKAKGQHSYLVEFGHRLWRGGDSRKGQGHQVGTVAAHPYWRPALDATKKPMRMAVLLGLILRLQKAGLPGKPGNATE
jgi:hypothetical protein